jgi:hypothetical protein
MDHLFATDNKALNRMSIWFATCINGQREIEVSSGVIIQDQVGEQRAAALLGLAATEIRRFSRLSGLGHLETSERGEQVVFTYEELRRLCLLAAQSSK